MKPFLHDTLFVFFIGIAIILGLEIMTRIIPSNNTYAYKYNYMETNSLKIKILLLGHSLFEESFNSNILGDSTFCLAISGRVSYYDVKLLERYIEQMPNLSIVLFPIHYALDNPCDYYNSEKKEHYIYQYYKYMRICTPGSMYLYYLPKITFQWEKKNNGIKLAIDSSGYCRLPDIKKVEINPPIERQYSQSNPIVFCNNIQKIAQICHEHHVRFIAVTPPATDIYLSYTTPDGISRINGIIESVRKKYPIEYKNYISDPSFRSDSLYHDCSHLNHFGATKFAQRVKSDFSL